MIFLMNFYDFFYGCTARGVTLPLKPPRGQGPGPKTLDRERFLLQLSTSKAVLPCLAVLEIVLPSVPSYCTARL